MNPSQGLLSPETARMDPTTARSLPPLDDIVMEMPQDRAMQQPRQPPDTGDDSDNQSSNDGIEWESSAYISSNDASEDEQDDGYRSSDGDEPDTQQLLSAADYSRVDGLGMGMRVGETGTGTTIGFGYDPDNNDPDEDYDALPLGKLHASRFRQSEVTNGRARKSKRRVNDARRTIVQPVLGLGAIRTEQEQVIAKKQFKTKMLWNAFFVFAWYGCSTSLSFYNKWLFSPNHHNFPYPLFTTCMHMVAQFVLSSFTLTVIPSLRPKSTPTVKDFGTKIMPCAVASGLDVGLSNSSLKTITLAFYTMCKSSSLAFVLLFAFAFKLERPTWTLVGVIIVICSGLFMMVMSEVDFVLIGFIQVMLASVLGGLRWSLTQLLLERTDTKTGSLANPISTIFFLSPIMCICLGVVSVIFEGLGNIFGSVFFQSFSSAVSTLGLLFLGGLFAFAMVLAEFNLIARTSVVSLSVLGIVKEVFTIVVSALVFHDQLTPINILGLFVTLAGIGFYNFMKIREMRAKARRSAREIAEFGLDSTASAGTEISFRRRSSQNHGSRKQYRHLTREAENSLDLSSSDEAPMLRDQGDTTR